MLITYLQEIRGNEDVLTNNDYGRHHHGDVVAGNGDQRSLGSKFKLLWNLTFPYLVSVSGKRQQNYCEMQQIFLSFPQKIALCPSEN